METCLQLTLDGRVVKTMARVFLLLSILYVQIGVSDQVPPRVSSCRTKFKAKPTETEKTFFFGDGESCVSSIVLPLPLSEDFAVNIADPRNCANYYRCVGPSCDQCPCPDGERFDPLTLSCSATASPCVCPQTTTESSTPKPTTPSTTTKPTTRAPTTTTPIAAGIPANDNTEQVSEKVIIPPLRTTTLNPDAIDDGVVIIAAMVTATVIIVLLLVVGFILWHRGLFTLRKKPQMEPANNDGYLHTLPSQERHVYAEIDERMISEANNNTSDSGINLEHSNSQAVPNHPPPACVHHPHQTYTLPQSFYASTPQFTYGDGHRLNKTGGLSPLPHLDSSCDNSSMTSCSGCSHCSASTNQTQLECYNLDRRTLLLHSNTQPPSQLSHVSKQVYV